MTDLASYFENVRGTGVLATADREGRVNVALYSRPHVMEDGTIAFVMHERLTRQNLEQNPHAAYLFLEEGAKREGVRLSLTRIRETEDEELIAKYRRRSRPLDDDSSKGTLRLVYFALDHQRPLIGDLGDAPQ